MACPFSSLSLSRFLSPPPEESSSTGERRPANGSAASTHMGWPPSTETNSTNCERNNHWPALKVLNWLITNQQRPTWLQWGTGYKLLKKYKLKKKTQPAILDVIQSFQSKKGEIFSKPDFWHHSSIWSLSSSLVGARWQWGRSGGGLGVEAGAPPAGQEVSVNGGVEETGKGVAVHQGVNLELGLLVDQVAGLSQTLVYSFSDPWVQTHLREEKQIQFINNWSI